MSTATDIDVIPADEQQQRQIIIEPVAAATPTAPTTSPAPTVPTDTDVVHEKHGLFGKKSKKDTGKEKKESADLQPCSITELFRFTTPAEKVANCITLLAAAAAGAAQVSSLSF